MTGTNKASLIIAIILGVVGISLVGYGVKNGYREAYPNTGIDDDKRGGSKSSYKHKKHNKITSKKIRGKKTY
jgi:hypothetical protein